MCVGRVGQGKERYPTLRGQACHFLSLSMQYIIITSLSKQPMQAIWCSHTIQALLKSSDDGPNQIPSLVNRLFECAVGDGDVVECVYQFFVILMEFVQELIIPCRPALDGFEPGVEGSDDVCSKKVTVVTGRHARGIGFVELLADVGDCCEGLLGDAFLSCGVCFRHLRVSVRWLKDEDVVALIWAYVGRWTSTYNEISMNGSKGGKARGKLESAWGRSSFICLILDLDQYGSLCAVRLDTVHGSENKTP